MIKEAFVLSPPPTTGSYSHAVRAGNLVFTSGQVGADPETGEMEVGIRKQVERTLKNLELSLKAAGSSLDQVVKTSCFLNDTADFAVFDEVYKSVMPEPFPARSTYGVNLSKGLLFEMEAVAIVSE